MSRMKIAAILAALGLTGEEYDAIVRALGRTPTHTELAMFSVEWSEHCSYRRSKPWLRQFPREGEFPPLIGEDAGGFVLGDLAVVFKVESHNHPSQVDPRHGAATGVGGIIRDILGSGARPVALLDSLRFGPPEEPESRRILEGVVDGIQWYGNCVGVPTVGGEIAFHPGYRGNCLVNVMCLGVAPRGVLMTSRARPGCSVLYLGARTGRDGIGGCSVLASQELAAELSRRPTVQIGDPFFGKCLIEATLECLERDLFVALKDMGAAGLTCTTTEMSAAGGCGMAIRLETVPLREPGMAPYEIMMSESQERMLAVVERGKEEHVIAVFHKWGLEAAVIGETIPEPLVRISQEGAVAAEVPVHDITTPPPIELSALPPAMPAVPAAALSAKLAAAVPRERVEERLLALLALPTIASKRWVWEQYDHTVQTNTVVPPAAGDAAVLRLKGRPEGLAATMDGNPFYTALDPYLGAQAAVAEAARNLIAVGAVPAAVTDGLNFGTPEKPDRFWGFVRSAEGIRDACRELALPVVSGNVSFYNESGEDAIPPTPIIGMVGVLPSVSSAVRLGFRRPGDAILLLGETGPDFGGSQLQLLLEGREAGTPPRVDWDAARRLMKGYLETVRRGWIRSAHDCAEGGFAVTLAESVLADRFGAAVTWPLDPVDLFSESQSRLVVSVDPGNLASVRHLLEKWRIPWRVVGKVAGVGEGILIRWPGRAAGPARISHEALERAYGGALPALLSMPPGSASSRPPASKPQAGSPRSGPNDRS